MLPIQPGRRRQRDEELAPVRIRPAVGHAQDAGAGVLEGGVDLVVELVAVDGGAAAAGAGRVARLEHEVGDYAVKEEVVVVAAGGEGGEVFAGLRGGEVRYRIGRGMWRREMWHLWGMVVVELEHYGTL